MRTNFPNANRPPSVRKAAIADYQKSGVAAEAFEQVKQGDLGAADKIADATGTNRVDVLAFVRDAAEGKAFELAGTHGQPLLGAAGLQAQVGAPIGAGGTVAHLTGYKALAEDTGKSRPLNAITKKKAVPSGNEVMAGHVLIQRLPVADQHAHEIGSAPQARIGESVAGAAAQPVAVRQQFLDGVETELNALTKGGSEPFLVYSLDVAKNLATAEVIASPPAESAFRTKVTYARKTLLRASTAAEPLRTGLINNAMATLLDAEKDAVSLKTPAAKAFLKNTVSTSMGVAYAPERAAAELGQFQVGILNDIQSLLSGSIEGTNAFPAEALPSKLADVVLRLRNAAALQKPNDKQWKDVDGSINGALEFFVRYKSVLGTHAGKMDGAGVAEIAQRRASAANNGLGYQELRADLDTDRFSRRFDGEYKAGMLSKSDLVDAAGAFATEVGAKGIDAFMTYALTKREVIANPKDPDEANIEAPQYAKQLETFVDAFFEGAPGAKSADAKTLQSGMNGIDHGGRESPERAPMLFIRGHGKRVVHNALELQEAITNASPELTAAIDRAVGNPELLSAWRQTKAQDLDPSSWKATVKDLTLDLTDTKALQAGLAEVVRESPMNWNVEAGAMSIEDMSRVNRQVLDAMRTHAATNAESVDVPQLGATNHTGEQIRSCVPDVLLDQVAQSLAMGADRLGHGVILGTDISTLYETGKDGQQWPTILSEKDRADPKNAVFAKSKAQVKELEQKREALLDRVIENEVVIEVNMTSNLVINDQTPLEHCINTFAEKMHEGLRFTINTDDETILATDIKGELTLAHSHLKLDLVDVSRIILESFRSRLGAKPLTQKDALVQQYSAHLGSALLDGKDEVIQTRLNELSDVMGVPRDAKRSPADQLLFILNKTFA